MDNQPAPAPAAARAAADRKPPQAVGWWKVLEDGLSGLLATPLTVQSGALCAPPPTPAFAAVVAQLTDQPGASGLQRPNATVHQRLALYQEQIWQRRLMAVQRTFVHLTEALGPWTVNQLTLQCLGADEVVDPDLARLPDLVSLRLQQALRPDASPSPLRSALLAPHAKEAFLLDEAIRRAHQTIWRAPTPVASPTLAGGVSLLQLRFESYASSGDEPPQPRQKAAQVVVSRERTRVVVREVPVLFARWLIRVAALGRQVVPAEFAPPALQDRIEPELLNDWLELAVSRGWLVQRPRAG